MGIDPLCGGGDISRFEGDFPNCNLVACTLAAMAGLWESVGVMNFKGNFPNSNLVANFGGTLAVGIMI